LANEIGGKKDELNADGGKSIKFDRFMMQYEFHGISYWYSKSIWTD